MKKSVTILKSDVERLGKELLKELYVFLNDEYMLTYPEVKGERTNFLNNLITAEFEKFNYTLVQREHSVSIQYEKISKDDFNKKLECLKDRIENGEISLDVMIVAIQQLKFENGMNELDEDLHGKVGSFKNIYNVYFHDYSYLED